MRRIEVSQFNSTEELLQYFDDFASGGFGTSFFSDRVNDAFFVDQVKNQNIKIFEYDYLCPSSDMRTSSDGDLILSPERKRILGQYKGSGSRINCIRENVLMFLNPHFTELEVFSGNILVDHKSKSAIFTGSFTLAKLLQYIASPLFDDTEDVYVFPYHEQNEITAPFHIERFLKLWIAEKVKTEFLRIHSTRIKELASKTYF